MHTGSSSAHGGNRLKWQKGIVVLGVMAWTILNLYVAFRCRFWINSDTIGTLDAARSLRSGDWINGLNGYFGVGFALFLTPLNLSQPSSFLGVHVINVALLLASQLLLYGALRNLNVVRWLAALATFVWAGTCYATGCAIYMTADNTLGFWCSLFIFLATKQDLQPAAGHFRSISLGLVHGIAGITKAIAFPTLLIFPLAYSAALAGGWGSRRKPAVKRGRQAGAFLLLYFIPLLVIGTVWGMACEARYGRFTLGGTATFNYELYTRKSESLLAAIEDAERTLPTGQSFWWSDPSRSLTGWSHKVQVDLADQFRAVVENAHRFLQLRMQTLRAVFALAILGIALLGILAVRRLGSEAGLRALPLAVAGWVCIGLYLSVVLYPRHLTFPALLCLPLAAVAVDRWLRSSGRRTRAVVAALLIVAAGHGVFAMVYAAEFLAPGGYHFQIADAIREASPNGSIGVRLDPKLGPRSYGIIAFLSGARAAEIDPQSEGENSFWASFDPDTVLLIDRSGTEVPDHLTVNGRRYRLHEAGTWEAGRTWSQEQIATYFLDNPSAMGAESLTRSRVFPPPGQAGTSRSHYRGF